MQERPVKEPERYKPPSGKIEFDSEYHSNYLGEIAAPAKMPAFLKNVTQRLPSGKIESKTTHRNDFRFHTEQTRCLPVSRGNKYVPPNSPFMHTSVHRSDFIRFNEPKRPTGRQPDKINARELPMEFETSNKTDFKKHSLKRNELVRRSDEYEQPSGPFAGNSLMHTDYKKHDDASKAQIMKPLTTVFKTNEKMERTTTNLEDFQTWPVAPLKTKAKEAFQQPTGEMYLKSTSMDYKYFGHEAKPAKSARPKTKLRTGRDGLFEGMSNYAADFKQWGSLPALPVKMQDELVSLSPRKGRFDANSEHHESFKRFNTAPARIFKPVTTVFKTDESMNGKTMYMTDFHGRPPPPCLSDKLLKGKLVGVQLQEDLDTGHRYVIGPIPNNSVTENNFEQNGNHGNTNLSSITEHKSEGITADDHVNTMIVVS